VTVAFVGIGSNLGNSVETVRSAFAELAALPHTRLERQSSLYRSAPVGYAGQPDFVNAVAQLETALPADRLLMELQQIEQRHGRERSFANAPRTLDLDILLFGNLKTRSATLVLPHPRMHERAFVLQPLYEVAPQASIPGLGKVRDFLEETKTQKVERVG
jgi:2-amino-4-hydroxy-6-hydroxymethyldihydropteridine diphosphokinase